MNFKKNNCQIILPKDVVICKKLENNVTSRTVDISDVGDDDIIADIGKVNDQGHKISKKHPFSNIPKNHSKHNDSVACA